MSWRPESNAGRQGIEISSPIPAGDNRVFEAVCPVTGSGIRNALLVTVSFFESHWRMIFVELFQEPKEIQNPVVEVTIGEGGLHE
jgi:hypothetical protein